MNKKSILIATAFVIVFLAIFAFIMSYVIDGKPSSGFGPYTPVVSSSTVPVAAINRTGDQTPLDNMMNSIQYTMTNEELNHLYVYCGDRNGTTTVAHMSSVAGDKVIVSHITCEVNGIVYVFMGGHDDYWLGRDRGVGRL